MRTALIILFLFLLGLPLKSQQQSLMFEKTWGEYWDGIVLYADELPNGEVNLIGTQWYDGTLGFWHYYICRIDKEGNLLWEKDLGDPFGRYLFGSVIKSKSGNYLIAGKLQYGDYDPYLMMIDPEGNQLFEYYDINGNGGFYDYGNTVCETEDSCFILAGGLNVLPQQNTSPTLIKVNQFGNEVWVKRQDSLANYLPRFIRSMPDGGILVAGSTPGYGNSYLAKYTASGDISWVKYPYGRANHDTIDNRPNCVLINPDGSFDIPYFQTNENTQQGETIIKHYDPAGDFISEHNFNFAIRYAFEYTNFPSIDPFNSSILSTCSPYNYFTEWIYSVSPELDTNYISKIIDRDSIKISLTYTIRTQDRGYMSVGCYSPDPGDIPTQFFLVKFGADGRYIPKEFKQTVKAYPNPSPDGNITLSFDMKTDETVLIRILSADGKLVYTDELFCPANSQTVLPVRLDASTANAGIYILEATTSTETYKKKLVVMRQY